jgi:hypothetical protein
MLGVKDLPLKSRQAGGDGIRKRLQSVLKGIRKVKGIIYDSSTERADFINRTYTGVDTLLKSLSDYLDASSDTPVEFLIYSGKAFESGTGGARQALAQRVVEYQKSHLFPALERFLFLYLAGSGNLDKLDDYLPIFSDGRIMTALEAAQTRFKKAQTDALLVNSRIIRTDNARLVREWDEPRPFVVVEGDLESSEEEKVVVGRNSLANALTSQQGREHANGSDVGG